MFTELLLYTNIILIHILRITRRRDLMELMVLYIFWVKYLVNLVDELLVPRSLSIVGIYWVVKTRCIAK